jgi:phospholipid/cholesterol/gamma-HCH transport system ATP-binding protein
MAQTQNNDVAPPIIRIRGLVNRFGSQVIHDGLDLEVRQGEVFGVVGGSGSGKSVLLRTIIGLNKPAAGTVEVCGQNVFGLSKEGMQQLERRWGVLFQDGALFSSLTVAENIKVALREQFEDTSPELMDGIAALKIGLVGLPTDSAQKYPAQLSGGMRKRAALARALALDPELLFLDEPTSGLDPLAADAFDQLIQDLRTSSRLTVFLVTHDLDTVFTICDRVGVIADKKLRVGTPAELMQDTNPWVRDYLRSPRVRAARDAAQQQRNAQQHPLS